MITLTYRAGYDIDTTIVITTYRHSYHPVPLLYESQLILGTQHR